MYCDNDCALCFIRYCGHSNKYRPSSLFGEHLESLHKHALILIVVCFSFNSSNRRITEVSTSPAGQSRTEGQNSWPGQCLLDSKSDFHTNLTMSLVEIFKKIQKKSPLGRGRMLVFCGLAYYETPFENHIQWNPFTTNSDITKALITQSDSHAPLIFHFKRTW